jgi:large subunit ribosomal protein L16
LSRMGKGCGAIKNWVAIIKRGTVILELNGVSRSISINALNSATTRLPLKVIIVERSISQFV